jgi:hypothetical protein
VNGTLLDGVRLDRGGPVAELRGPMLDHVLAVSDPALIVAQDELREARAAAR